MSDQVYARVPFNYGQLQLERGEVFALQGARNDEKLLACRHVMELKKKTKTRRCDDCGKEFVEFGYSGHRVRNHRPVEVTDRDFAPLAPTVTEEV